MLLQHKDGSMLRKLEGSAAVMRWRERSLFLQTSQLQSHLDFQPVALTADVNRSADHNLAIKIIKCR